MDANLDIIDVEEFNRLYLEYKEMSEFLLKHRKTTYIDFDYYVINDLMLFTIEPDIDLKKVEELADRIIKSMSSLKKIFAKPVLHLIENREIVPVESVRVINNNTIQHIVNHSELWKNIKNNNIEPLKLLTKTYQDDYSIYENIVFCRLIDEILSFTKHNLRFIKNLIYTNQTIELNLLERVNHVNYFLALGKLHTGYIRSFNKVYSSTKPCLGKLNYIYNSLMPRLKSPVYRKNRIRPKKFNLHKTNILAMHKDYQKVYRLYKHFFDGNTKKKIQLTKSEYAQTVSDYFYYCEILSVFSLGHFNFSCRAKTSFDLTKLRANFAFKKWKAKIELRAVGDQKCIVLELAKDMIYKIVFIPTLEKDTEKIRTLIMNDLPAEEYIVFSPYEDLSFKENFCHISISNVDSFRRIQQIILRGMIYSDTEKKDCPFCSEGHLEKVKNAGKGTVVYSCETCRTQIHKNRCQTVNKTYYTTDIANYTGKSIDRNAFSKDDKWLYLRMVEGRMFYRNITRIDENSDVICPCCGKIHEKVEK